MPGYRTELTPFGGVGDSGLGVKEGVREAMRAMSYTKLYTLPEGGPMSEAEIEAFCAHRAWRDAVALRLFDDRGKVPGAAVPDLASYRGDLDLVVRAARAA